jgi:hypothetical protein
LPTRLKSRECVDADTERLLMNPCQVTKDITLRRVLRHYHSMCLSGEFGSMLATLLRSLP